MSRSVDTLHVAVDGRVASATRYAGPGPTVVLVPGAGGNRFGLAELAAALSGNDVIVPSLPGRPESEGPPLESVAAMADFVHALLAAAGVADHVLAGHSLGGAVALELALRHGEEGGLRGLVLMATGARLRVHPQIVATMRAAAESGAPAELGPVAWQTDHDPALFARYAEAQRRTPPAATLADWLAADAFDRMADLAAVPVPGLVIGGEADALTPPKYAAFLAAHLPRAELTMLPGAGHMLPVERAEEVARHVARFATAVRERP